MEVSTTPTLALLLVMLAVMILLLAMRLMKIGGHLDNLSSRMVAHERGQIAARSTLGQKVDARESGDRVPHRTRRIA